MSPKFAIVTFKGGQRWESTRKGRYATSEDPRGGDQHCYYRSDTKHGELDVNIISNACHKFSGLPTIPTRKGLVRSLGVTRNEDIFEMSKKAIYKLSSGETYETKKGKTIPILELHQTAKYRSNSHQNPDFSSITWFRLKRTFETKLLSFEVYPAWMEYLKSRGLTPIKQKPADFLESASLKLKNDADYREFVEQLIVKHNISRNSAPRHIMMLDFSDKLKATIVKSFVNANHDQFNAMFEPRGIEKCTSVSGTIQIEITNKEFELLRRGTSHAGLMAGYAELSFSNQAILSVKDKEVKQIESL